MKNTAKDFTNDSIYTMTLKSPKKAFIATFLGAFTAISALSAATPPPSTKGAKGDNISGFYLGAELGYSAIFQDTSSTDSSTTPATTTKGNTTHSFALGNIGAKLGYTHFFNKWVGLRGYASYTYAYNYTKTITPANATEGTAASTDPHLISHHQVAANVDVAFRFFETKGVGLGGYAGIGAGYAHSNETNTTLDENTNITTTTTQNLANGFVLPVNVGLEVYMGKHHNASLNFRIPTLAYKGTTTTTGETTSTTTQLRNLIITLGYSYTF